MQKDPQSYFPGWGEEVPILVLGGSIVAPKLQESLISCWGAFPTDANGVPSFRPSEMIAINYDNRLDRSDVELYADIFRSITSGYKQGMSKGTKYKKDKKPSTPRSRNRGKRR